MKILLMLAEKILKNLVFPVVNYSTWNLRFVLNILPMIVSEYSILLLFAPGTFRLESFDNCCNWKTFNTILTQN